MHPGGECRSAYKGASQDLNSRLRLVAQMSSPTTCSKSFLLIFWDRSNATSCSFSFRVLSGVSSIVSRLKLIDHPHQVRSFWNCIFFQEMGALMPAKNTAERSSTNNPALCGCADRMPCSSLSKKAPVRCHQYAENRAPKWHTR